MTLTIHPAGLAAGTYLGQLIVRGSGSAATMPVKLYVAPPTSPQALSFVLTAGTGTSPGFLQDLTLGQFSEFSVQTQTGGNWLSAIVGGRFSLSVGASAVGLAPGIYQGAVTAVTSSNGTVQVPVTLTVLAPIMSVKVDPPNLSLSAPLGQDAVGRLRIDSANAPGFFRSGFAAVIDSPFLNIWGLFLPATPAILEVRLRPLHPGTYYYGLAITWDGGSVTVPIALNVTAVASLPPILATVTNAASQSPAAIAPGVIISILGMGIGPAPAAFTLDSKGKLPTSIDGTQVLIDGKPAPLLYVSSSQVNAIVPYEVGTTGSASLQVISNGIRSESWGMPLAASAPALFSIESTGLGQGAVLNQDYSINGASNPAAVGTVVQIFATGGGQTTPPSATGGLAGSTGDATLLPATVTIGGVDAPVTYHGSAPGLITGLLQVNAVVPSGITPGPAVPVFLAIGGRPSQSGITIAVE